MPPISGSGGIWTQMRSFDSAGKVPAAISASAGNFDSAFASAAHTVNAELQLPVQRPHADRPRLRGRRRDRERGARDGEHAELLRRSDEAPGRPEPPDQPDPGAVLRGSELVRELSGALRLLAGGRRPVAARRGAGAPPVHALGRARLGQLRAGPADGHPGRRRRERQHRRRSEYTQFAIPGISQTLDDPTRQQVGVPLPAPGLGVADTSNSGTQYNIPNRRVVSKSLPLFDNYFKTSSLRAPQAPQTVLRLRADDRRARARSEHGPVPVPAPEHHDDPAEPVARRARRDGEARELAAEGRGVESLDGNVVTGRGIALGGFATRRPASSSTSP